MAIRGVCTDTFTRAIAALARWPRLEALATVFTDFLNAAIFLARFLTTNYIGTFLGTGDIAAMMSPGSESGTAYDTDLDQFRKFVYSPTLTSPGAILRPFHWAARGYDSYVLFATMLTSSIDFHVLIIAQMFSNVK